MKKFLINIVLFILIAGLLATALDYAITSGLHKRTDYVQEVWNDVMNPAVDPDVIVLGNCVALHDHSPHVIDSVLNVDSYVFAMSNLTFPYHDFMWEMLKQHKYKDHSPKLIILALDYSDLVYREAKTNMENEQFLSLFYDKRAREFLCKHGGYNWLDATVPCYRYYGHKKRIKYGLMNFLGVSKYAGTSEHYKGYIGLDSEYSFSERGDRTFTQPIDNNVIALLDNFMTDCYERGIHVVVTLPPICYELTDMVDNDDEVYGVYESLAKEYGFDFISYCDPFWMSMDTTFFQSPNHLNERMSNIYSLELANYINSQQLLDNR